jgi:hypothetical protein
LFRQPEHAQLVAREKNRCGWRVYDVNRAIRLLQSLEGKEMFSRAKSESTSRHESIATIERVMPLPVEPHDHLDFAVSEKPPTLVEPPKRCNFALIGSHSNREHIAVPPAEFIFAHEFWCRPVQLDPRSSSRLQNALRFFASKPNWSKISANFSAGFTDSISSRFPGI